MTATATTLNTRWYVDEKFQLPRDILWPRKIGSFQQIPVEFRDAFPAYSSFPYVIFLPGESDGYVESRARQMVVMTDDELVVMSQETFRKPVHVVHYALESITHLNYGSLLLHSWLTINGPTKTTVPFHSVADHLFRPILQKVADKTGLDVSENESEYDRQKELAKLAYIRQANLKFFNAVNKYAGDDRTIVETAYQPQTLLSSVRMFTLPVYEKHLTAHLAVLTETALILVKESQSVKKSTDAVYGELVTYIPLRKIRHIAFEKHSGLLDCVMNVILTDNTSLRTAFSTSTVENLAKFKTACLERCVFNR